MLLAKSVAHSIHKLRGTAGPPAHLKLYSFREKEENVNVCSSPNTLNIDVTEMTVGENYRITLYLAFIP